MSAVKTYLVTLRVPLILEATTILFHRIAHWSNLGSAYIDTASLVVSAAAAFLAGWLAMRQTRRIGQAVIAGILVWGFSLVLVAALLAIELFVLTPPPVGEAPVAMAGYLLASMLFLPAVVAIAGLAALIAAKITVR